MADRTEKRVEKHKRGWAFVTIQHIGWTAIKTVIAVEKTKAAAEKHKDDHNG